MKTQTADQANKCMLQSSVKEDVEGCKCNFSVMHSTNLDCSVANVFNQGLTELPGGMPVT